MTFARLRVSIATEHTGGGGQMLVLVRMARELRFGELMGLYEESNLEKGRLLWPHETEARQLALAEQDFFDYLRQVFFTLPGAMYCIWQKNGRYVSALRLEPWKDGLLLTGLETAPQSRNRGCACDLIRSVQAFLSQQGPVKLYSHIRNCNKPSIRVHEKCGFQKVFSYAAYTDGSVDVKSGTYRYELRNRKDYFKEKQ